ncbi:DUF4440 domain-containing protein [Acidipila rosea]|uniref:DUF4440 domain-containing protein n=1 Tax=Acidipila rosea TaxID=768535 RepID=A0A4R1LB34_9BACT|nr:DUF4440 domain-containing protein [Acidipila rosea]TCK75555.1 hypothetical protein C7378_0540 [Acidipila rosea]
MNTHADEELVRMERVLLRPEIRHDERRMRELLADEFVEFGSSGRVFNKAQILADLGAEAAAEVMADKFQVQWLAESAALLTYHSSRREEPSGKVDVALRCSIWVLRDTRWQIVFHQGTRAAIQE